MQEFIIEKLVLKKAGISGWIIKFPNDGEATLLYNLYIKTNKLWKQEYTE